jgi:hypothetical protein
LVGRGVKALGQSFGSEVSVSGERLLFFSPYGLEGAGSDGFFFLATRGVAGWSAENVVPLQSVSNNAAGCPSAYVPLRTPELTDWVLADGYGQGDRVEGWEGEAVKEIYCGSDEPLLVEGEPQGFQNLFLHDAGAGFQAGSYQLIDALGAAPGGAAVSDAWAQGASEDLSRVVFSEAALLTPEAPAITPSNNSGDDEGPSEDLYVWSAGTVRLVTVLPGGAPVAGSLANGDVPHVFGALGGVGSATFTHAVSSDGERVAFSADGNLYVRENPEQPREEECATSASACTVQLDASQGGSQAGGGHFQWASSDGARVFFTDEEKLTGDSTAASGEPDLYEYDFGAPVGERLTDLTVETTGVEASPGEHANVQGVSGVSEDGSVVYFVADGALAEHATPQTCSGSDPGEGCNLYVDHYEDGAWTTTFVATLGASDSDDWESPPQWITSRVSPDGAFIAFDSLSELTGYHNQGPCVSTGSTMVTGACQEIFLYDSSDQKLSCASCSPTGAPATAPARIGPPISTDGTMNEYAVGYLQRFLSDSGQVFFNTVDRLLPGDTNGLSNVYEYENGQLYLLSNGSGTANSYFSEASANGENVFLLTSELLNDTNGDISLFDARVNGGYPEPPTPPPPCNENNCRGAGTGSPSSLSPGSAAFTGPDDLVSQQTVQQGVLAAQVKIKPSPTRAQKLASALASCRKRYRHAKGRRVSCERLARKRYGPVVKKNKGKPASASEGSGR